MTHVGPRMVVVEVTVLVVVLARMVDVLVVVGNVVVLVVTVLLGYRQDAIEMRREPGIVLVGLASTVERHLHTDD